VGDIADLEESESTQIDLNSIVPSLRKMYYQLWNKIELSMLGYHIDERDKASEFWNGTKALRKTLSMLGSPLVEYIVNIMFLRHRDKPDVFQDKTSRTVKLANIDAWKLACMLRESGVNCFRCRLCRQIGVASKTLGSTGNEQSWIVPCCCTELLHRNCLEKKLGLVHKFDVMKFLTNRHDDSPKMWISYDTPFTHNPNHINGADRFDSSAAVCNACGQSYRRTVRLPKDVYEVLTISLNDRLAVLRFLSTIVHFIFCILMIAGIEGACTHDLCQNNIIYKFGAIKLGWPGNQFKGISLLIWQLQQSCMLHIFFSRRFVAIVDRLWLHPLCRFYVKLYLYFVLTSFLLMISFIPIASRWSYDIAQLLFTSERIHSFIPFLHLIAFCNMAQYLITSSTVIAIFWRTNYRMFTVATRAVNGEHRMNDHPIYHGQWR
jgi:hypothetical protein